MSISIPFYVPIYPADADTNPMFGIYHSRIGNSGTPSWRPPLGTLTTLDLISETLGLNDLSVGIAVVDGSDNFTASGIAQLTTRSDEPLVLQVSPPYVLLSSYTTSK